MKGLMFVVALGIGFVAYNAARMDDIAATPNKDWLPPSQPVTVDTSQMDRMMRMQGTMPGLHR
jgi:hypothetical protein